MKTLRWWMTGNLAAFMVLAAAVEAAEDWTEYRARPGGSRMTIEGTSNVHDWKSEGVIVGGTVQTGPSFVADPAALKPGKVELKANVFIPVRSLKSVKADGSPYSAQMDDIMYEKLRMSDHPRIEFRLTGASVKEGAKAADGGVLLDVEGELVVGGVTKPIALPVTMKVLDAKRLEFSGSVSTKMTTFDIEPPVALAGAIRTGDEVKLSFEWVVARR
jgi:polyisoprenoid-binding protein YceI